MMPRQPASWRLDVRDWMMEDDTLQIPTSNLQLPNRQGAKSDSKIWKMREQSTLCLFNLFFRKRFFVIAPSPR